MEWQEFDRRLRTLHSLVICAYDEDASEEDFNEHEQKILKIMKELTVELNTMKEIRKLVK